MEILESLFYSIVAVIGFLSFLTIYFLPFYIAREKRSAYTVKIFWLNFTWGWTGIFWLGLMVWVSSLENSYKKNKK